MDWSHNKIINTVKSLRNDSHSLNESQINEKYSEFKEKFPKLFYMCMTPNFDIECLNGLLNFRDKAERDNISDLERDVAVGEKFAKRYLYPVVGKEPSIEEKKEAAKKVAAKYFRNKNL